MKLYHGSPNKLKGNKLKPTLAEDLEANPENMKKGVYASNIKEMAIAMAIISTKGVIGASLNNFGEGKYGKIYLGKPNQKYIYLHTLPPKIFKKCKTVKNQYFSKTPIKPIKSEKIPIKKYISLIKYATKEEIKSWKKKNLRFLKK